MNITSEGLYAVIVEIKSETEFKAKVAFGIVEIKAAQLKLRLDINKRGVALFTESIAAMTLIIGLFLESVMLTVAK